MIVSWNTTNKCNLNCSHCYRDAGEKYKEELNTEEAKTLIDQISKAGFKVMIFSGGEPLMREDIFELIEHASKSGLRPVMGSNGTLITKEVAQKLKKSGTAAVGISLDSLDSRKHDKFRGYDGAYNDTVKAMKNCKEAGLKFQIHTTVMDWNRKEIIDISDFAVDIGAFAYHIFFLVPTGRGEKIEKEMLSSNDYEELLSQIMKKQQQVNIEIKPTCAPQFIRVAERLGTNVRFSKGCIAGVSYCIINPKGQVQPCAYLNEISGDVRKIPFDEIWREGRVFNELRTLNYKGSCGRCSHKNSCGGCRARAAFYHKGDYMAEESSCIFASK